MTIQQTTFFPTAGDGSGSGLTRLSMRDKIFSSAQVTGNGAGFIIIQRGEFTALPRPRGPRRLVTGRIG
jgi:hypothetical protein